MLVIIDGRKVRRLREELYLDRQEFADRVGVSRQTSRIIERHPYKLVRLKTARRIASALGVRIQDIACPAPDALAGITDDDIDEWLRDRLVS